MNLFKGLASGTLLYVVFFEILHKHRTGLVQYLSILLGFGLMFAIQIFSEYLFLPIFLKSRFN